MHPGTAAYKVVVYEWYLTLFGLRCVSPLRHEQRIQELQQRHPLRIASATYRAGTFKTDFPFGDVMLSGFSFCPGTILPLLYLLRLSKINLTRFLTVRVSSGVSSLRAGGAHSESYSLCCNCLPDDLARPSACILEQIVSNRF